jgi:hypothetical protein
MDREWMQKPATVTNNYVNGAADKQFFEGKEPADKPFFSAGGKQPHQFTPGRPAHNHPPQNNWPAVQAASQDACLSFGPSSVDCTCAALSPAGVMSTAAWWELSGNPVAEAHLDHYLTGSGKEYNEDTNFYNLLVQDKAVRSKFGDAVHEKSVGSIPVWQGDYTVEDYRLAFGGIDRVDFEAHNLQNTVDIWFIDMYEFHPVGFGHQDMGVGDDLRSTNCVHAAAVEMKNQGAADFWMKGQVTVSMSWLLEGRGYEGGGGGWL